MTMNRARVSDGANSVRDQQPGEVILSQLKVTQLATVGNGLWTAAMVLGGIINRTGPVGAYGDTLPDASDILLAQPTLSVGDSFTLKVRNTVAFLNTVVAGVGIVLGANVNNTASLVREYLFTVLSGGKQQIYAATVTNGTAIVTVTPAQAVTLQSGMGVTGAGIPALTTVIGVNATTGDITLSANSTASAVTALTFFPRISVIGVCESTL